MGEPLSTVLGGLGVVGIVTVCLDCFDVVQDGLNLGKDYLLMEGRFSALRIRLFAWSKACGFMSESGPDPRLTNAVTMSLLSLMSDPDVEDPLVLEIAALYVKDKLLYEKNARKYTKMYATLDQRYPEYGV